MTGQPGPAPQPERQPERLGLIGSLAVIFLPLLDGEAGELTDGPCGVCREPEAQ